MIPDRSKEGIAKLVKELDTVRIQRGCRIGPESRAIEMIEALQEDYWQLRDMRDQLAQELAIAKAARPAPSSGSKGRL